LLQIENYVKREHSLLMAVRGAHEKALFNFEKILHHYFLSENALYSAKGAQEKACV